MARERERDKRLEFAKKAKQASNTGKITTLRGQFNALNIYENCDTPTNIPNKLTMAGRYSLSNPQ